MVINAASKTIHLAKIVQYRKEREPFVESRDRVVDGGRKLQEKRMIEKLGETVERDLTVKRSVKGNKENAEKDNIPCF